jgi:hypothetical protein
VLAYSIKLPEGILVLSPQGPLAKDDFAAVNTEVNAFLADHARLRGVMVHAKTFPGWDGMAGFGAHLHFVREHHFDIERLALVTDSQLAGVAEMLGKRFTSAKVRHFAFAQEAEAMAWLEED